MMLELLLAYLCNKNLSLISNVDNLHVKKMLTLLKSLLQKLPRIINF
jgi:hypothetical protein